MKRFLIPQMLHEWRSNLWLIIELMIVSGVVCYLTTTLCILLNSVYEPLGFEPDDVYTLTMRVINPESDEFSAGDDAESIVYDDIRNAIARLRSNPHVEAVAVSHNAYPFTMNLMGNSLNIEGMPDSIIYQGNLRRASPDIVRVLRLNPVSGISPEEMEARMRRGEIVLSSIDIPHGLPFSSITDLVGKKMAQGRDSLNQHKVGAIIPVITRNSYESRNAGMILVPIDEATFPYDWEGTEIILRVKKGEAMQFEEQFKTDPSIRRFNNVVLNDLQSLHQRQKSIERTEDISVRLHIAMIGFLLSIVFLGLLGSFWYRVQQRTSEIALRKVTGATNRDIFRRFMSEATILLLAGFLSGAVLFILIIHTLLMNPDHFYIWRYSSIGYGFNIWRCFFIGIGIAYVIMQLIVLIGIWFPARRAISIEPAIALKDE